MAEVLCTEFMAYERGRRLFLAGKPCPPKPPDDAEVPDLNEWLWIGYRCAKGLDWMHRRDIAHMLAMPEPEWKE